MDPIHGGLLAVSRSGSVSAQAHSPSAGSRGPRGPGPPLRAHRCRPTSSQLPGGARKALHMPHHQLLGAWCALQPSQGPPIILFAMSTRSASGLSSLSSWDSMTPTCAHHGCEQLTASSAGQHRAPAACELHAVEGPTFCRMPPSSVWSFWGTLPSTWLCTLRRSMLMRTRRSRRQNAPRRHRPRTAPSATESLRAWQAEQPATQGAEQAGRRLTTAAAWGRPAAERPPN